MSEITASKFETVRKVETLCSTSHFLDHSDHYDKTTDIANVCPHYFPHYVLLQVPKAQPVALITSPEDSQHYEEARQCVEELALYLKPLSNTRGI